MTEADAFEVDEATTGGAGEAMGSGKLTARA